ncbi:hypothetical protein THOM_0127, partial [Trachipleistophora hominis]
VKMLDITVEQMESIELCMAWFTEKLRGFLQSHSRMY